MPPCSRVLIVAAIPAMVAGWLFCRVNPPFATAPGVTNKISLRVGLDGDDRMTAHVEAASLPKAILIYTDLTGRELWPDTRNPMDRLDTFCGGWLARLRLYTPSARPGSDVSLHRDGLWRAVEVKERVEAVFAAVGLRPVPKGSRYYELVPSGSRELTQIPIP